MIATKAFIPIAASDSTGVAKGEQSEQMPPIGLDSDKIIVGSVVRAAELD